MKPDKLKYKTHIIRDGKTLCGLIDRHFYRSESPSCERCKLKLENEKRQNEK